MSMTPSDASTHHPLPSASVGAADVFCPHCTYNLRGLSETRCPECGQAFDSATLRVSRIPWVHREHLGRLRAYWRTVWLVIARGRTLAEEVSRPVSYTDAQRFRWVTILHVVAAAVAASVYGFIMSVRQGYVLDSLPLTVAFWATLPLWVTLFAAAATGLPSYFCHPKRLPVWQQNRCIALSYYTMAALAFTPLTVGLGLAALIAHHQLGFLRAEWLITAALGILTMQGLLWWVNTFRAVNAVTQASGPRTFLVTIALPVLWLLLAALILFALPGLIFYVILIFASLR